MYGRTRTPPYIDHLFSIKIDNLPFRSNMGQVERYFKKFGRVGDIYIPRDSRTHESRGFAFVRYYDERDAEDAINTMDGALMDGREVQVSMARNGRPANDSRQMQHDRDRSFRNYSREDRDYNRGGRSGYSSYSRGDRDSRDCFRDRDRGRRYSPPRRRRSPSPYRRKKSPSPRYHRRAPSKSPRLANSPSPELGRRNDIRRSRSRSHSSQEN